MRHEGEPGPKDCPDFLSIGRGAVQRDLGGLLFGAREQLLVGLVRPLGMRFVDVVAGVRQQLDVDLTSDLVSAEAHDHPVARLVREAIAFHGVNYPSSSRCW